MDKGLRQRWPAEKNTPGTGRRPSYFQPARSTCRRGPCSGRRFATRRLCGSQGARIMA